MRWCFNLQVFDVCRSEHDEAARGDKLSQRGALLVNNAEVQDHFAMTQESEWW